MKNETREKKFKCPYGCGTIQDSHRLTENCFYFGCLHQINDTCPILRAKGAQ